MQPCSPPSWVSSSPTIVLCTFFWNIYVFPLIEETKFYTYTKNSQNLQSLYSYVYSGKIMVSESNGVKHSPDVIRSSFLHLTPELKTWCTMQNIVVKIASINLHVAGGILQVFSIWSCTIHIDYEKVRRDTVYVVWFVFTLVLIPCYYKKCRHRLQ